MNHVFVEFLQKFGVVLLAVLLVAGTIPFVAGCSQNELQADATVLASALNNLAGAIQATDPTVAADLERAANSLTAAANGTGVGPVWEQALNGAAAGAEAILASIPVTAPFAILLSIAVAAAEAIITKTATKVTTARVTSNPGNLLWYLRTGTPLVKHSWGRSQSDDFKAAWNAAAVQTRYSAVVLK
jgi:hypothetical protein